MKTDGYFQFPLCALSFGKNPKERLNAIISFGLIEAGHKLFQKLSAEKQREFLHGKTACSTNSQHCAAYYGAHVIGVNIYDLKTTVDQDNQLRSHIVNFESREGRDAVVRIKKSWLFDARDDHGLTYREFSVLCGIFSAIGDKELAIVTRDRIRRCSLGYRTAAIMAVEIKKRADKEQPLTMRQVRDAIEQLHRNKFFARCTVARRHTYYSIRLDGDALRKKILERRTYPTFFHASQSAQDEVLTAAIKQKRRELAQPEPATPSLPSLTSSHRRWTPLTTPAAGNG